MWQVKDHLTVGVVAKLVNVETVLASGKSSDLPS